MPTTLTLTLTTNRTPRCPICQEDLPRQGTTLVWNVALCPTCRRHVPVHILQAAAQHALHPRAPELWSISSGVTLFTPPPSWPRKHAAHVLDGRPTLPEITEKQPEHNEIRGQ